MATYHGKEGVVKIGSDAIAERQEFTIVESVDVADATAQGDTAQKHHAGIPGWSISLTCWFDDTDSAGQEALTIGAAVAFELFPAGEASGRKKLSGTATVVNIETSSAMADTAGRSFEATGNGALTHATVSA